MSEQSVATDHPAPHDDSARAAVRFYYIIFAWLMGLLVLIEQIFNFHFLNLPVVIVLAALYTLLLAIAMLPRPAGPAQ